MNYINTGDLIEVNGSMAIDDLAELEKVDSELIESLFSTTVYIAADEISFISGVSLTRRKLIETGYKFWMFSWKKEEWIITGRIVFFKVGLKSGFTFYLKEVRESLRAAAFSGDIVINN